MMFVAGVTRERQRWSSHHASPSLAMVAVVLLATACGSTVAQTSQVAQGQAEMGVLGGTGLSAGTPTQPSGAVHQQTLPGGNTEPMSSMTGNITPTTVQGPGSPPPGTAASIPTTGRGWDAGHIYIGISTSDDAHSVAVSSGAAGVDPGDIRGWAAVVAADLNRSGGLYGRQVVPFFHDEPLSQQSADPNGTAAASCVAYTQDRPVAGVIDFNLTSPALLPCLAKSGVPLLGMAPVTFDDFDYRQNYGTLFQPGQASYSQILRPWVGSLVKRGYFSGGARVGILYNDSAAGGRLEALLKRELTSRGVSVASEFRHSDDVSKISAEMASAVLRFQSAHVNRVMLTDGLSGIMFPKQAESQQYRPRYSLTSAISPNLLAQNAGTQFKDAVGIGWMPGIDVPADAEGEYTNADTYRCTQLLGHAGHPAGTGGNRWVPRALCDAFWSLRAVTTLGHGLDGSAILRGFNAIGDRVGSANTFAQKFSARRHYGAATALDLKYLDTCACFHYVAGTEQTIP